MTGSTPVAGGTPVVPGEGAVREAVPGRRAWEHANAVVGLYGDPTVPWSIVLQADLDEPLPADEVRARMGNLVRCYPHLGPPPDVVVVGDVPRARDEFACRRYDDRHSLVRVGLAGSPPALVLAAHHGAVDGLGLLALLQAATGQPVRSTATGLAGRPASHSFVASAARRVAEALFAPPTRLGPADPAVVSGQSWTGLDEVLAAALLPPRGLDTAALTAAAVAATVWWNAGRGRSGRIVAGIGASRRDGADLRPEHRAAYLRLRLRPGDDRARVREALRQHAPEPDFPPSRSRIVALVRRALAARLGATFLTSNLGLVQADGPIRALSFYPQPSGPLGVAFGAVSTAAATSLTVRARRRALPPEDASALLRRLVAELSEMDGTG